MRAQYAKISIQVLFISLLAFLLIGCSGSSGGSHHDDSDTATISLSASSTEVPADGSSSTAITATLTDSTGQPVAKGTDVSFSTTIGRFDANGSKTYSVDTTDDSGTITVALMSEEKTGKTKVKATSNGVTQGVEITFVEGGIAEAASLSLGTSSNTVNTDNSDSAEITAVVLDKDRAPVEDITVAFTTVSEDGSAGAGQLSDSSMVTDENGQAVVEFSAGIGDKKNQVVTVVATVEGLVPKQVPIQVRGTRVEIVTEGGTNLEAGVDSSTFKVILKDASENPIPDAQVKMSLAQESTGIVAIDPGSGTTDLNGEIQVTVKGLGVGDAIVQAEALGASATQTYTIDNPDRVFKIIDPEDDVAAISTNEGITVTIRSPGFENVTFAATIGTWENSEKIVEKSVSEGKASAVFKSGDAGTATIHVYASDDPGISDTIKIAVSATANDARKIDLQASENVVPLSTEKVKNSVTLIATVRDASNYPVGNAPVLFRLETPIGGGEYVSPAIVYTDSSGKATSTFTSGSLASGADGVSVTAGLINIEASDNVNIVIGGQPASVTLGRGTDVESINNGTSYRLPMSVLVTQPDGSPFENAKVTLTLWPSHYSVGEWNLETTQTVTPQGEVVTLTECVQDIEGTRPNEDVNKNLILDTGEDINGDGQLTPSLSAAGSIPNTVTTDENGVAEFNLDYPQSSATWITDEITATTQVAGTEASVSYRFILPPNRSDREQCYLSNSPYFFEEEGMNIAISKGKKEIVADGTSTVVIWATVSDDEGTAISGETVEFTTTLGSFTSARTVTTDVKGAATITLQSEKALGAAVVTANASGFTDQVEVKFVGGPPASITLQALPGSVAPGGTSTILATLTDEYGNPVEGETVNFKIANNNSAATPLSPSATTNENGQATVSYTAGEFEGTDQVQAVADSNQSVKASTWIEVDKGVAVIGSMTLSAAPPNIPADGVSSTAITATLTDSNGNSMPEGTSVLFETTSGRFSTSGGQTTSRKIVGDSGTVVVTLISSPTAGTATVTATSGGISQSTTVTFTGEGVIPAAAYLSLSTSKTSIKTNGTDKATITATVLDVNRVPIQGTSVNFSTDGGQISSSNVKTDENGQATIDLSSGPDKKNGIVTVTATSGEVEPAIIPINLQGTEITITPATAQVSTGNTQSIVIQALDADNNPIFDAEVVVRLDDTPSPPADLNFSPALPGTFQTDLQGKIYIELQAGATAGNAEVIADAIDSLGASATGTYQIGAALEIFEITDPSEEFSFAIADGSTQVDVTVHAGGLVSSDWVEFYTSFGRWVETGTSTASFQLTSDGQDVTRHLVADDPGVATVDVYEQSDLDPTDTVQVSFYNPSDKAYGISVEASQSNILPSTGATEYSITITAEVFDVNNKPVGDATVNFSLSNTTGGGEYLSPAIVTTDPAGIAQTTFTSGTKGTGSEPSDAVLVTATVATPAHPTDTTRSDSVPIVIREDAANISIGYATEIDSTEDNTQYLLPVSVLVADTNGNPVVGKQVSLSLRPSRFKTGKWEKELDEWKVQKDNPCTDTETEDDEPYIFVNEDLNNNAFLDIDPPLDEDQLDGYNNGDPDLPAYFDGYDSGDEVPGLDNGMLTPGQSSAGSIPAIVETDENGVASFTLRYQKEYAVWIEAQITASATVFGTENITRSRKWLPYMESEEETIAKTFSESPFNILPCGEVP